MKASAALTSTDGAESPLMTAFSFTPGTAGITRLTSWGCESVKGGDFRYRVSENESGSREAVKVIAPPNNGTAADSRLSVPLMKLCGRSPLMPGVGRTREYLPKLGLAGMTHDTLR